MRRGSFELVTSYAGHLAVLDHDTRELMHPVVGPRVESVQLYVEPSHLVARLSAPPHDAPLVLLDVGLGAGSNAAAALAAAARVPGPRRPLWVHSFDRTTDALMLALERPAAFGFDAELAAQAARLVSQRVVARGLDSWRLSLGELPGTLAEAQPAGADVVFWDPFSPRQNPGLWGVAAFAQLRPLCRPGATLHTYSGATATRTALLLAGFAVGLGAPLGPTKRASVAALDAADLAEPLGPRFLARLARSSAPLPADAPSDALARLAALPQLDGSQGELARR